MKKIIAIFWVIGMIFSLTGCFSNPEEMEWEGYSDMPFKDMLKEGISKKIGTDVNVSIKEGWDTTRLDADSVDKAYTFVIDPEDEDFVIDFYEFFMTVEDDKLVAKGAVAHSDYEDDFIAEDDAYNQLKSVAEELK